jgi:hypothetical protein
MSEIAGLKLITPSSVSAGGSASASVSATGKVTFSSVSNVDTVTINDCFVGYDNYLVVWRGTLASGNPALSVQLTASGTPATASNYTYQRLMAGASSVSGARASAGQFHFGQVGGGKYNGAHIYFYGPSLSQPTAARSVTAWGTDDARIDDSAGTHSLSTSYDGFIFWLGSGGSGEGALTIYGLSQ